MLKTSNKNKFIFNVFLFEEKLYLMLKLKQGIILLYIIIY